MDWKYILFDLDGTLTNSKEGILNCVKYALEAKGVPVPSEEELMPFIGPPLMVSFQKYTGFSEQEAKEAVEKYRQRYAVTGLFENAVYEGIEDVLKKLKEKGCVLAVATSKPEVFSKQILEHFHLDGYFQEIVGSALDGSRDNKEDVIREVFRRLSISEDKKEQVLMVGDRKHDIIGAKQCQIKALGVYYGFAPEGEMEAVGADYIIHSVADYYEFFDI